MMRLRSSLLLFTFAASAMACAPAPGTQIQTHPDAGYDHKAPPLPDDPGRDSSDRNVGTPPPEASSNSSSSNLTANQKAQILSKYNYVDPTKAIRTAILQNALLYFEANKAHLKNVKYLSIVDFSLPSNIPRFHIINMTDGSVWSVRVAHGKGSDSNNDGYADSFSNTSGSNASSLGFYLTAETYSGSHGYSLRLDGLSSTNSNVRNRAIVVHGADYVVDANQREGRSWGCFAVSMTNRTKVIDMLRDGSLIYAMN